MSFSELTQQISSLNSDDLLSTAQAWYDDSQKKPDFLVWLEEAARQTELTAEQLATLRVALFCLAKDRDAKAFPSLLALITSGLLEKIAKADDWAVVNLHRILGSLIPDDQFGLLTQLSKNVKLALYIREQIILTIQFLWVEKRLPERETFAAYRNIIQDALATPANYTERIGMALVINAAVVGGSRLQPEAESLLRSGIIGDRNGEMIAKAIPVICNDIEQYRSIFQKQHKGFFDKLEEELPAIHVPVVEELQQLPGKGTPIVRSEPKVGRNDPCPCGSGKKYKKCCGAKL